MKISTYNPALDGMRAIAILLVMAYHFKIPGFESGYLGVDIFFVLSGYLITSLVILERSITGGFRPKHFYIRRIIRLYPALILFMLPMMFVVPADQTLSGLFYYSNLKLAFGDLGLFQGPLCILWSLSIEEQYYLLWPWLLSYFLKIQSRALWLLGALIVLSIMVGLFRANLYLSGATYQRWYFGTDTRIDGLLVGSGLAVLLKSDLVRQLNLYRFSRVAFWSGSCTVLSILAINSEKVLVLGGLSMFHLGVALILFALVSPEATLTPRFLMWKPLVYVGQISYGLYLWHQLINSTFSGLGSPQLSLIGILVRCAVSLLIASISYIFIEKPILHYKDHFQPQLRPKLNSA
jgi:peptidoglycan/LPS O-acetylase OafA/YrhL